MTSQIPTTLPGDTLRKAVEKYGEIKKNRPNASHTEILQSVAIEFDLSPLQCDFLDRQLKKD